MQGNDGEHRHSAGKHLQNPCNGVEH
jgi:hypothetical protein